MGKCLARKARRFEFSVKSRISFVSARTSKVELKGIQMDANYFYYSNETDTRERNFKGIF